MDNNKHNAILRQWQIIDLLIKNDRYLSSQDIKDYLMQCDMDVDIRTIQRDLNALHSTFNLECNKSDKPYSWRWRQISKAPKHTLTLKQALAFVLVDTELQDFIPDELMMQLRPAIERSYYLLANHEIECNELSNHDFERASYPTNSSNRSLFEHGGMFQRLVEALNTFKIKSSTKPPTFKVDKKAVKELNVILQNLGLVQLSEELKNLK